jgi:hypothetical protein
MICTQCHGFGFTKFRDGRKPAIVCDLCLGRGKLDFTCTKCGETKTIKDYYRYADKMKRPCKACQRKGSKRWRAANLECARQASRDWHMLKCLAK